MDKYDIYDMVLGVCNHIVTVHRLCKERGDSWSKETARWSRKGIDM